jgi:hypothetical protein
MKTETEKNSGFQILFGSVVVCGLVVLVLALYQVQHHQQSETWFMLALLAAVAGSFSLKIPGMNGRVSAGDTVVFLSMLMAGPYAGVISATTDAVFGSLRCKNRSLRLKFALYNGGNAALSAFIVGEAVTRLAGGFAAGGQPPTAESLLLPLILLSGAYYLMNTVLVAGAVALEKDLNFIDVWRKGFMWTCANYVAGAFVAGVLVLVYPSLSPALVGVIFFSSAGIYISCRAHIRLARAHVAMEARQGMENPAA